MHTQVQIDIDAAPEKVWNIITDIENSVNTIRGIEKVEIHNKPSNGIVGLKWTETRMMFGKTATETMWVTDAVENKSYSVRAESHGAVYLTSFHLEVEEGVTLLTTEFLSEPQSFGAKLMNFLLGGMMRKATATAFLADLDDIKNAAEASA